MTVLKATQVDAAEALIRAYYTRVDDNDPAMFELFHPDIRYKRPGYPLIEGMGAFRDFYSGTRIIKEGSHQVHSMFRTGSRIAVEGWFTGVLRDGSRVQLPFSDFFDLVEDDGAMLIVSRRTYFDDTRV
ncbi:hypothetical protein GCM10017562_65160 [Streptomyces roseofulvus]|uniref:nuclear transport factor 2 family protein n=1 Tax=Streptomyces roseofulvus TaxID=33902 RepID=UPI0031FCFA4F